jgi:hypothetical protein
MGAAPAYAGLSTTEQALLGGWITSCQEVLTHAGETGISEEKGLVPGCWVAVPVRFPAPPRLPADPLVSFGIVD